MAQQPQFINWLINQPMVLTPNVLVPAVVNSPTSTSYTVLSTDYFAQISSATAGGTLTLTLPNTLPNGFTFFVTVVTNSIVLSAGGGANIKFPSGTGTGNSGASFTLSNTDNLQSATILFDGTNFWLLTTQGYGQQFDIEFVIGGSGGVISTGNKGWLRVPVAATISTWHVMADVVGSITIDILRANDAVPSSSMVGAGTKPNLTASQFTEAAPASWTSTTLASSDWLTFDVTAATTVTLVTIVLTCSRI